MSKLRTILLAKQIRDKEAELEALRARDAEFQTREADLAEAIESAETDEERSAVEESVTALEAEQNEADYLKAYYFVEETKPVEEEAPAEEESPKQN